MTGGSPISGNHRPKTPKNGVQPIHMELNVFVGLDEPGEFIFMASFQPGDADGKSWGFSDFDHSSSKGSHASLEK